ncbi:F-BAR and double SH3 domains protein 2-like [Glandiceps talaboti]
MQPPPRKTKITQHVRNTHSEQVTKLHAKHQLEYELLEDIRDFAKQRSSIEKTYSQSLIKLAQDFYQKRKFPAAPDIDLEDGKEYRTILNVWRAIIEETGRTAKARYATAEKLTTEVADNAKTVKTQKSQLHKKCSEILNALHEEVDMSIRDMTKSKKSYIENETLAKEVREKSADAENKLKRGSVKIFQSKAALEKNCAKLATKRDLCNRRSTFARNEYIINTSAANAHQKRYYSKDIPELIETLDGNVYNKFQEYFRALSSSEVATSTYTQNCFNKVLADADKVSRNYELQCFLQENTTFTDIPYYMFEPVDGDQVSSLCLEENLNLHFNKEARKWATKVARENKVIKDLEKKIVGVQTLVTTTFRASESQENSQPSEAEQKLDELKSHLRKSETSKLKVEAKLECLRSTEIDVDEWLNSAQEAVAQEDDSVSRTGSHTSSNSAGSSGIGVNEDLNRSDSFTEADNTLNDSFDDTFDASTDGDRISPMPPTSDKQQYPVQCVALYDYEAQREDELSIKQSENLEIIEESEGDGWVRGRNAAGDVGYFPEAYVDINKPTEHVGTSQIEPSSYTSTTSSVTDMEVRVATTGMGSDPGTPSVCMARALYDYSGVSDDELSFSEGQLIKITRKDENGVDDGFWEGELNGKVGVFPSLVVEEVEENDVQTPGTTSSSGISSVFIPPSMPPPQSSSTLVRPNSLTVEYGKSMQDNLASPEERVRPASVNITEQSYKSYDKLPTPTYEQARSAPQSPTHNRNKPFRSAPPPPGPGSTDKKVLLRSKSADSARDLGMHNNDNKNNYLQRRKSQTSQPDNLPQTIQEQGEEPEPEKRQENVELSQEENIQQPDTEIMQQQNMEREREESLQKEQELEQQQRDKLQQQRLQQQKLLQLKMQKQRLLEWKQRQEEAAAAAHGKQKEQQQQTQQYQQKNQHRQHYAVKQQHHYPHHHHHHHHHQHYTDQQQQQQQSKSVERRPSQKHHYQEQQPHHQEQHRDIQNEKSEIQRQEERPNSDVTGTGYQPSIHQVHTQQRRRPIDLETVDQHFLEEQQSSPEQQHAMSKQRQLTLV